MKMKNLTNLFLNKQLSIILRPCLLAACLLHIPAIRCQSLLSIEDAVQQGMKNNYGIRIAKTASTVAANNVTYGNAGFLPAVNAYATYDRSSLEANIKVESGAELYRIAAPGTLTTAGLQAQWVLFNGRLAMMNYQLLKGQRTLSELELKAIIENTVSGIIIAYYDLVRQEILLQACQKRLDISNFRLFLATEKKNAGSASELELLQAAVKRQSDTAAYAIQLSSLNAARIRLNQLMSIDLQQQFITSGIISLSGIPDLKELINNCTQRNTELNSQEEIIQLSQLELKAVKAVQYPRLVLRGAYGYYENENSASFIHYNRLIGPQIGISAGITLFDGMNQQRKISNARLAKDINETRKKQLEQDVVAELLVTYSEYSSQKEVVSFSREALTMAERNMRISSDAYKVGMISSLVFREAQDDLFQAEVALSDALFKAKVKETELLRLSGVLVK